MTETATVTKTILVGDLDVSQIKWVIYRQHGKRESEGPIVSRAAIEAFCRKYQAEEVEKWLDLQVGMSGGTFATLIIAMEE